MARRSEKPLVRLTFSLLRDSISRPEEAIAKERSPKLVRAKQAVLPGGVFYYHAPPARPPSWVGFLTPAFDGLDTLRSRHASGVLFFKTGKRWLACTFGYGQALLDGAAVESSFGIRTALNLCDPDTLRAIDFRTIEERTRIGRIQVSQAGGVGAFRVDTDTDLLRGVEAASNDASVCERVGAKWSTLTVAARVEIDRLPALGRKLVKLYAKPKLPAEFRWIDNVQKVADGAIVSALDAELGMRLDARNLVNIRIAIPELMGLNTDADARMFAADGAPCESDAGVYLDSRPRKVANTVEAAKVSHKVHLVDLDGKSRQAIPVYRCLVAEVEHQGALHLLVDGEWFRLERDFVADVNKAMKRLKLLPTVFPGFKAGTTEGSWNEMAAKTLKATLLDKKTLAMTGRYTAVEPADLLTDDRVFLHVKRRDKSSGGLSHLFAQGRVATEMFNGERTFREKLAARLGKAHRLYGEIGARSPDPKQWTIAYVLLGADPKAPAESLPFFSKVNLRKHVQGLESMQYSVRIAGVAAV